MYWVLRLFRHRANGDDVDWVLLKLNSIELMLNTAYEKQNRPPEPDEQRIAAMPIRHFISAIPILMVIWLFI
jgi:hypothetical protein